MPAAGDDGHPGGRGGIVLYNIIIVLRKSYTTVTLLLLRRLRISHHPLCPNIFCSPVTREIRDDDDDVDDGARTDGRCEVHTRTHTSDKLSHTHTRTKRHTDTAAARRRRRKQRTQHVTTTYERSPRLRLYESLSLALTQRAKQRTAGRRLGGRLRHRVHCHGKPPLHWNAGRAVTAKEQQALRTNTRCYTSAHATVCVCVCFV